MSEPRTLDDARGARSGDGDGPGPLEYGRTRLQMTVVDYTGRPDRVTIHPPELTGVARMETWLSVDSSVVVDLDAWR